ncbi:MAG: DNA polymerase I, partial [Planctomycetaceae bacterium]|nr:DNA polymerase I [Planctomycetaceae bacterium]
GDSVDNVPGVPLVGPKKAQALLEEFGTLENVLANADKARGKKLQENLKNFAEQAYLSRTLVTLQTDLPLEFDWDAAKVSEPNWERLEELFTELAFKRYADEARKNKRGTTKKAAPQGQLQFRDWENIDTPAKFEKFLKELKNQKSFCVDLETTTLDAVRADIVGWAICWEADHGCYLPVDGPPGQPKLEAKVVLDALKPLIEDPGITKVNQNIKYDMLVLRHNGVELQGIGMDPMVGDYLLESGARSHSLDTLADRYLGRGMIPISDLIGKGSKQIRMNEVDIEKVAEYASEDADFSWQIAELVTEELKSEKLWDLYWDLERPLIPVLADMEFTGIRVDAEELKRQSDSLVGRLEQLEKEIYELAGQEFNIGSPKQLAVILFEELNLPVIKRTKTGPSTNVEVLEELAVVHELPAKIIEHRQLAKLKSTYLDALPELINPETGNIHCSFNQVVAATGRLSSSDPNLQNIPIRTEEGRRVRRAFVPSESGWKLVCADYSQIELRVLAHFSQDEALQNAFKEGIDIHASVAAEIFETPLDQVTSEQRRVAKAVNFGVMYGQSPFGLSNTLRIPKSDAAEFIDNYFDRYAGVEKYMESLLEECQESGYARTILGRRRRIEGIKRTQGRQRNLAERTAINTAIQGSAADLIKRAMLAVHHRMKTEKHPGRMLLQIHDELVFEAPQDEVDSLIQIAREEMSQALKLDVPLVVDVKTGDNWLDAD